MTPTLLPIHGSNRRSPRIALFVLALTLSTLGIFMMGIDVGVGLRPPAGRGGAPFVSESVVNNSVISISQSTPMKLREISEEDHLQSDAVNAETTIQAPRTKIISKVGGTSLSTDQPVREVSDENMAEAFGNGECGVSVFRAIGLQVTVEAEREADADGGVESEQITHQSTMSFIVTSSLPGRDLQLAGRAFSLAENNLSSSSPLPSDVEPDLLVLSPSITRLSDTQWRATFGPCYDDDGHDDHKAMISSMDEHTGAEKAEVRKRASSAKSKTRTFDFDIIATWLGTKFLGQKWRLPDRNDNPPFATMKKKCLDLRLEGDCEQYGLTLATSSGAVHSQARVKKTSSSSLSRIDITRREGKVSSSPSSSSSSVFPPISLKCLPRRTEAPLCSAVNSRERQVDVANEKFEKYNNSMPDESPLFGNGQWRSIGIPDGVRPEFDDGAQISPLAPNTADVWPHVKAILDDPVGLNHFLVVNKTKHAQSQVQKASSPTYYSLVSSSKIAGEAGESTTSTSERSVMMAWEPPCRMHPSISESQNNPIGSPKPSQSPRGSFLGRYTAKQVVVAMHKYFGPQRKAADADEDGTKRDNPPPSPSPPMYTIALFGDSMMVEQFHVWCHLLHGEDCGKHVRQGKSHNLRWMNIEKTFNISDALPRARVFLRAEGKREAVEEGASSHSLVTLRVRFARSYTTKGGHSVIAPVATIVRQLLSVDPDIVAGNLASLHWQQNMRTQRDWEENLKTFSSAVGTRDILSGKRRMNGAGGALLLRYSDNEDETHEAKVQQRRRRRERLFFYWGNTMIQMGRTQGLNSGRTNAFNDAARRLLGGSSSSSSSADFSRSTAVNSRSRSRAVTYFNPYYLSVARRESSFDGQHWACYHRYGGVSASITQLWIAYLLESSLRSDT